MSPVHIDELDPQTRARVPEQLSGTDTVTNSDEPQLLPASMADEPLAEIVVSGCKKFRTLIPYVIELRKRFNSKIRGNADIAGCRTWTEFCEKHLDRTTSAVQRAIAVHTNPNPADRPHKNPSKQCLPPAPDPAPVSNPETAPQPIIDAEFVDTPQPVEPAHKNPTINLINNLRQQYASHPNIFFEKGGATRACENPDVTVRIENVSLRESNISGKQKITVRMTLDQLRSVKGVVDVGSDWLNTRTEIKAFLKMFGVKP